MTSQSSTIAMLRQIPQQPGAPNLTHLLQEKPLTLGRDPHCQIVIDSGQHGTVSRRHAQIRPTSMTQSGLAAHWWICDLNSSNGTYLNGERLHGCQVLKPGDRVMLGSPGPEFVFEQQRSVPPQPSPGRVAVILPSHHAHGLATSPTAHPNHVTLTQLFPILSDGLELQRKAYLVPATITVSFVVALFLAVGHATAFNLLLAIYLAGACYYVIYRLCGKPKPWWVLVSTAVLSAIVLRTPVLPWFATIFRDILPGQVPLEGESIPFPALLVRMFFGAGLMEELLKILPVLFWLGMGLRLRSPWKQRCGVLEPLDGILLGAASAIGLTLMETLGQYVPSMIQNTQLQAGTDLSHLQLMGLQLLIPRLLGSIAGHIAYSGYLGYFVGLAVLQPQHRWRILGIGYMTTSALHALWNATGIVSPLLLALVGILSYAFLAAAIVKARLLSPTRAQNFATRLK